MKKKIMIMPGCPSCDVLKSNGMCKDNDCSSITTNEGVKIMQEAKVSAFPQEVCWSERKQKWIKCGNYKKLEKKYKKKKKY